MMTPQQFDHARQCRSRCIIRPSSRRASLYLGAGAGSGRRGSPLPSRPWDRPRNAPAIPGLPLHPGGLLPRGPRPAGAQGSGQTDDQSAQSWCRGARKCGREQGPRWTGLSHSLSGEKGGKYNSHRRRERVLDAVTMDQGFVPMLSGLVLTPVEQAPRPLPPAPCLFQRPRTSRAAPLLPPLQFSSVTQLRALPSRRLNPPESGMSMTASAGPSGHGACLRADPCTHVCLIKAVPPDSTASGRHYTWPAHLCPDSLGALARTPSSGSPACGICVNTDTPSRSPLLSRSACSRKSLGLILMSSKDMAAFLLEGQNALAGNTQPL